MSRTDAQNRLDFHFNIERYFFENFEANFEKCYHQHSKRCVIRKKSDKHLR